MCVGLCLGYTSTDPSPLIPPLSGRPVCVWEKRSKSFQTDLRWRGEGKERRERTPNETLWSKKKKCLCNTHIHTHTHTYTFGFSLTSLCPQAFLSEALETKIRTFLRVSTFLHNKYCKIRANPHDSSLASKIMNGLGKRKMNLTL